MGVLLRRNQRILKGMGMSATDQIRAFVEEHRACGDLTGNGSPATADGYQISLRCGCGAELDCWVPMAEATAEIADLASEG
ncbi:MAG TPA: hypothetical protein VGR82_09390 [Methylomirabilota bacterium]|nr:hypothetical protein [Methylomirabilota bacterium]